MVQILSVATLTLEALLTAPFKHQLHVLPGVAIQTFVHGPHRIYADVSLVDGSGTYPIALMSYLITSATVDHAIGNSAFSIAAGAMLRFQPAAPSAQGQATLDCDFVTPTARTPFKGQIAMWPYA